MKIRISGIAPIICLVFLATTARADDTELRSYLFAEHGTFQIEVPKTWRGEVLKSSSNAPPTLTFAPGSGEAFQLQVAPIWTVTQDLNQSLQQMKRFTDQSAKEVSAQAVEKSIPVVEFKGQTATGYYFAATDKAPKPGEYKYQLQGMVRTGDVAAMFIAVSNDDSRAIDRQIVAAMRSLAFHPNSAALSTGEPQSVRADAIQIASDSTDLILTVPVSRLVVRVPKGGLEQKVRSQSGSAASPRYFYFEDETRRMIISGWFEPADGFKGVKNLWADEVAAWRKNSVPLPQEVSFAKLDRWDVVNYEMSNTDPTPTHIRACFVQAGTWIDIHLSMGDGESSQVRREKLTAILRSMSVTEKRGDR
jgi:hypothetical protein